MPGRSRLTAGHHAGELALIGCAALAWYLTFLGLSDMSTGPGTMGLRLGGFLAVWTLMMAAMMLPALAPLTSTYLRSIRAVRSSRVRALRTTALVGGYLLTWIGFGVVAYAAAALSALLAENAADIAPWVGAGVLVAAGAYQLTPLKDRCLIHCRSPLEWIPRHMRPGRFGAFRMGVEHGTYCVGCCWALMLLLFVGGVMNLLWVAGLTLLVAAEKLLPRGTLIAHVAGVAMIGWGVGRLLA